MRFVVAGLLVFVLDPSTKRHKTDFLPLPGAWGEQQRKKSTRNALQCDQFVRKLVGYNGRSNRFWDSKSHLRDLQDHKSRILGSRLSALVSLDLSEGRERMNGKIFGTGN